MKKIVFSCTVSATLFSCNEGTIATKQVQSPVDSLIANWTNAWNNHDQGAVAGLFSADALLIDDNLIAHNTSDIATQWIQPNINVVSKFKAGKMQEWYSGDRAGYTGTYEFDAVVNDSVVARPNGVFTVNWLKSEEGVWKVTVADIHGFTEKK